MSILIVEDNPVTAKLLEMNLQKHRYRTIVARTGKQALECLQTINIELVITDLMMPEMDGLELLRLMKEDPAWRDIPVIISTSQADVETVKQAAALGCQHYVLKPIHAAKLLGKVRELVGHGRQTLRDKFWIMSDLGMDLPSYEETALAFAVLVNEKIAQLEQQLHGETPAGLSLNLVDLSEGALILGAERIGDNLEGLITKGAAMSAETLRSEYGALLRELKLLQRALPALPAPAAPSAEPVIEESPGEHSQEPSAESATQDSPSKPSQNNTA